MALVDATTRSGCPSHYWLITEPARRLQLWSCLRYGAELEKELHPAHLPYRWAVQHPSIKKPEPVEPVVVPPMHSV